jgi:hypothetical protein
MKSEEKRTIKHAVVLCIFLILSTQNMWIHTIASTPRPHSRPHINMSTKIATCDSAVLLPNADSVAWLQCKTTDLRGLTKGLREVSLAYHTPLDQPLLSRDLPLSASFLLSLSLNLQNGVLCSRCEKGILLSKYFKIMR